MAKISKMVKNYHQQNLKNSQNYLKIDKNIKRILKQIDSKLRLDETKYLDWSKEDVVKFVFLICVLFFQI